MGNTTLDMQQLVNNEFGVYLALKAKDIQDKTAREQFIKFWQDKGVFSPHTNNDAGALLEHHGKALQKGDLRPGREAAIQAILNHDHEATGQDESALQGQTDEDDSHIRKYKQAIENMMLYYLHQVLIDATNPNVKEYIRHLPDSDAKRYLLKESQDQNFCNVIHDQNRTYQADSRIYADYEEEEGKVILYLSGLALDKLQDWFSGGKPTLDGKAITVEANNKGGVSFKLDGEDPLTAQKAEFMRAVLKHIYGKAAEENLEEKAVTTSVQAQMGSQQQQQNQLNPLAQQPNLQPTQQQPNLQQQQQQQPNLQQQQQQQPNLQQQQQQQQNQQQQPNLQPSNKDSATTDLSGMPGLEDVAFDPTDSLQQLSQELQSDELKTHLGITGTPSIVNDANSTPLLAIVLTDRDAAAAKIKAILKDNPDAVKLQGSNSNPNVIYFRMNTAEGANRAVQAFKSANSWLKATEAQQAFAKDDSAQRNLDTSSSALDADEPVVTNFNTMNSNNADLSKLIVENNYDSKSAKKIKAASNSNANNANNNATASDTAKVENSSLEKKLNGLGILLERSELNLGIESHAVESADDGSFKLILTTKVGQDNQSTVLAIQNLLSTYPEITLNADNNQLSISSKNESQLQGAVASIAGKILQIRQQLKQQSNKDKDTTVPTVATKSLSEEYEATGKIAKNTESMFAAFASQYNEGKDPTDPSRIKPITARKAAAGLIRADKNKKYGDHASSQARDRHASLLENQHPGDVNTLKALADKYGVSIEVINTQDGSTTKHLSESSGSNPRAITLAFDGTHYDTVQKRKVAAASAEKPVVTTSPIADLGPVLTTIGNQLQNETLALGITQAKVMGDGKSLKQLQISTADKEFENKLDTILLNAQTEYVLKDNKNGTFSLTITSEENAQKITKALSIATGSSSNKPKVDDDFKKAMSRQRGAAGFSAEDDDVDTSAPALLDATPPKDIPAPKVAQSFGPMSEIDRSADSLYVAATHGMNQIPKDGVPRDGVAPEKKYKITTASMKTNVATAAGKSPTDAAVLQAIADRYHVKIYTHYHDENAPKVSVVTPTNGVHNDEIVLYRTNDTPPKYGSLPQGLNTAKRLENNLSLIEPEERVLNENVVNDDNNDDDSEYDDTTDTGFDELAKEIADNGDDEYFDAPSEQAEESKENKSEAPTSFSEAFEIPPYQLDLDQYSVETIAPGPNNMFAAVAAGLNTANGNNKLEANGLRKAASYRIRGDKTDRYGNFGDSTARNRYADSVENKGGGSTYVLQALADRYDVAIEVINPNGMRNLYAPSSSALEPKTICLAFDGVNYNVVTKRETAAVEKTETIDDLFNYFEEQKGYFENLLKETEDEDFANEMVNRQQDRNDNYDDEEDNNVNAPPIVQPVAATIPANNNSKEVWNTLLSKSNTSIDTLTKALDSLIAQRERDLDSRQDKVTPVLKVILRNLQHPEFQARGNVNAVFNPDFIKLNPRDQAEQFYEDSIKKPLQDTWSLYAGRLDVVGKVDYYIIRKQQYLAEVRALDPTNSNKIKRLESDIKILEVIKKNQSNDENTSLSQQINWVSQDDFIRGSAAEQKQMFKKQNKSADVEVEIEEIVEEAVKESRVENSASNLNLEAKVEVEEGDEFDKLIESLQQKRETTQKEKEDNLDLENIKFNLEILGNVLVYNKIISAGSFEIISSNEDSPYVLKIAVDNRESLLEGLSLLFKDEQNELILKSDPDQPGVLYLGAKSIKAIERLTDIVSDKAGLFEFYKLQKTPNVSGNDLHTIWNRLISENANTRELIRALDTLIPQRERYNALKNELNQEKDTLTPILKVIARNLKYPGFNMHPRNNVAKSAANRAAVFESNFIKDTLKEQVDQFYTNDIKQPVEILKDSPAEADIDYYITRKQEYYNEIKDLDPVAAEKLKEEVEKLKLRKQEIDNSQSKQMPAEEPLFDREDISAAALLKQTHFRELRNLTIEEAGHIFGDAAQDKDENGVDQAQLKEISQYFELVPPELVGMKIQELFSAVEPGNPSSFFDGKVKDEGNDYSSLGLTFKKWVVGDVDAKKLDKPTTAKMIARLGFNIKMREEYIKSLPADSLQRRDAQRKIEILKIILKQWVSDPNAVRFFSIAVIDGSDFIQSTPNKQRYYMNKRLERAPSTSIGKSVGVLKGETEDLKSLDEILKQPINVDKEALCASYLKRVLSNGTLSKVTERLFLTANIAGGSEDLVGVNAEKLLELFCQDVILKSVHQKYEGYTNYSKFLELMVQITLAEGQVDAAKAAIVEQLQVLDQVKDPASRNAALNNAIDILSKARNPVKATYSAGVVAEIAAQSEQPYDVTLISHNPDNMFAAVAAGLNKPPSKNNLTVMNLRLAAIDEINQNRSKYEASIQKKNVGGDNPVQTYINNLALTETPGDETTLLVLANCYGVNIHVLPELENGVATTYSPERSRATGDIYLVASGEYYNLATEKTENVLSKDTTIEDAEQIISNLTEDQQPKFKEISTYFELVPIGLKNLTIGDLFETLDPDSSKPDFFDENVKDEGKNSSGLGSAFQDWVMRVNNDENKFLNMIVRLQFNIHMREEYIKQLTPNSNAKNDAQRKINILKAIEKQWVADYSLSKTGMPVIVDAATNDSFAFIQDTPNKQQYYMKKLSKGANAKLIGTAEKSKNANKYVKGDLESLEKNLNAPADVAHAKLWADYLNNVLSHDNLPRVAEKLFLKASLSNITISAAGEKAEMLLGLFYQDVSLKSVHDKCGKFREYKDFLIRVMQITLMDSAQFEGAEDKVESAKEVVNEQLRLLSLKSAPTPKDLSDAIYALSIASRAVAVQFKANEQNKDKPLYDGLIVEFVQKVEINGIPKYNKLQQATMEQEASQERNSVTGVKSKLDVSEGGHRKYQKSLESHLANTKGRGLDEALLRAIYKKISVDPENKELQGDAKAKAEKIITLFNKYLGKDYVLIPEQSSIIGLSTSSMVAWEELSGDIFSYTKLQKNLEKLDLAGLNTPEQQERVQKIIIFININADLELIAFEEKFNKEFDIKEGSLNNSLNKDNPSSNLRDRFKRQERILILPTKSSNEQTTGIPESIQKNFENIAVIQQAISKHFAQSTSRLTWLRKRHYNDYQEFQATQVKKLFNENIKLINNIFQYKSSESFSDASHLEILKQIENSSDGGIVISVLNNPDIYAAWKGIENDSSKHKFLKVLVKAYQEFARLTNSGEKETAGTLNGLINNLVTDVSAEPKNVTRLLANFKNNVGDLTNRKSEFEFEDEPHNPDNKHGFKHTQ